MVVTAELPRFELPSRGAMPSEDLALFRHQYDRAQLNEILLSPEFLACAEAAAENLKEMPTEMVWEFAARKVWLDAKMSADEGFYNPAKTPWTKEIQELPLTRPDVRVAAFMKSSRSGLTEACLNILRWMPGHWPGNAGVVFPEDKQGRDVAKRRIVESIKRIAGGQISDDPHDMGLSNIHLLNMLIKIGPSGSARMFTEWWVRYFLLDEIEEHSEADSTTTYDRALSRQVDVDDSLLCAISKPKKAGGIIHRIYLSGTQKQWTHPCPRCERPFTFARGQFMNDNDCRNTDGTWDLTLVEKYTFCLCPNCSGRIWEAEKEAMNEAAIWVPRSFEQRQRGSDGRPTPATPGVESYHISDYSSYHKKVGWGKMRVMELLAFEIQPTRKAQVHFTNNHLGLPEEPNVVSIDAGTIDQLVAGRVETRRVKQPDGTEREEHITHGIPGGYRLAYRLGKLSARLPYVPTKILLFTDKQKSFLKYSVWALRVDASLPGMVEAHLIDLGREDDETTLRANVVRRPYFVTDESEPAYISAGLIDSRYRGQAVYRFCLGCFHELGLQIWPVRGEGEKDSTRKKGEAANEKHSKDATRGRALRFVEDICDLGKLQVRYFKDHTLQTELNDRLNRALGWRLWLPIDSPPEFAAELIAEKYDKETDTFIHNATKDGPNDWRDTTKMLCLWLMEHLNPLLQSMGIAPQMPEPEEDDEGEARGADRVIDDLPDAPPVKTGRDYILKSR